MKVLGLKVWLCGPLGRLMGALPPPYQVSQDSLPWELSLESALEQSHNDPQGTPCPADAPHPLVLLQVSSGVFAAKSSDLLLVLMLLDFSALDVSGLSLHLKAVCPLDFCHCILMVLLPPRMCS